MNGSWLGRGRGCRLALLGCIALGIVFVMFVYRSASSEMTRLRDLHVKCAQQQEALAAQLQVIYEYKIQLEKTLSNEKNANAAVKEELQKKASKERSLRDKDIIEAMQRFNSLQQNYKLLQTEHQDLKDDCKKKETVALEDSKRLESTLQELRIQLKQIGEDKEKSMENLKIKYMELVHEKEQLQDSYNNLRNINRDSNGNVEHLQKQIIQLQRELDDIKKFPRFSIGSIKSKNTEVLSRHSNKTRPISDKIKNNNLSVLKNNQTQVIRSSPEQQTSISASKASLISAVGFPVIQSPPESSNRPLFNFKSSSTKVSGKVKLPVGVPPIPRLIEAKTDFELERFAKKRTQESAGQASPFKLKYVANSELKQLKSNELQQRLAQQNPPLRVLGEQTLNRHEADGWYKLKPGIQEVGDPHHIEKSGFENEGGNEDVEQYDDYNYKEPLNKNSDLRIEEGEVEREDEDDYIHNSINIAKHK